jgi:hypothetical protein
MSEFTDLIVEATNPEWLDETVQQLPNCVAVVVDGSWDGAACTVRVLSEVAPGFVKFAIGNQGYGIVRTETNP